MPRTTVRARNRHATIDITKGYDRHGNFSCIVLNPTVGQFRKIEIPLALADEAQTRLQRWVEAHPEFGVYLEFFS